MGLEERIVELLKKIEEEKRLSDKRIKQAIATTAKARAYLSADQADIADQTWTVIELNAESYDSGSNFNTTTHKFIVPRDGFYHLIGNITWKSVVTDVPYQTGIFIGSSAVCIGRGQASSATWVISHISDIRFLSKDNEITLRGYHNAGVGTVDVHGAENYTYLTVHLLSI